MQRLVDDLRRLSHAEAGQLALNLAPVSPKELIRLAIERMLPLFEEKGVGLSSVIPEMLPPTLADTGRIVQVLTNLLDNALRHTPPQGRVMVGAKTRDNEVVFEVADTGEGIASEHLPHVFERFYRAEKSRSREGGGSGVGLTISRALVEAMGGRVWVESPGPGKGATFAFTLPISRQQP
jgi:signal transduction histidine kinase